MAIKEFNPLEFGAKPITAEFDPLSFGAKPVVETPKSREGLTGIQGFGAGLAQSGLKALATVPESIGKVGEAMFDTKVLPDINKVRGSYAEQNKLLREYIDKKGLRAGTPEYNRYADIMKSNLRKDAELEKSSRDTGVVGQMANIKKSEALQSRSGAEQFGQLAGDVGQFIVGGTKMADATKALPFVQRILPRVGLDIATSIAQGSDLKTAGKVGLTSAAVESVLPGASATSRIGKFAQTVAPGYVGDVASGLTGMRGEDRTGAKAFIPGLGTAITGTVASIPLITEAGGKIKKAVQDYNTGRIQKSIQKDTSNLLKKTTGLAKKTEFLKQQGTDIEAIISEPEVFRGLKIDKANHRIIPDEAIDLLDARLDRAENIKKAILPKLNDIAPTTPKTTILDDAVNSIKGKFSPTDRSGIVESIKKQLDGLPDNFNAEDLDNWRAVFRQSARDAKGLMKSGNEYAALENAFRDNLFKVTDNLPIDSNKEILKLNNYMKDLLRTKEVLDTGLRGQVVKGGRLTNVVGRVVGATAGIPAGFLGSVAGSEVGGQIANIITNNQLGSGFKMKLIGELTTDPKVLKDAESFLNQVDVYNSQGKLPLGVGDMGQGQMELPLQSRPVNLGQTKAANIIKNSDSNINTTVPQVKKKVNMQAGIIKNPFVADELPYDKPLADLTKKMLARTSGVSDDIIEEATNLLERIGKKDIKALRALDILKQHPSRDVAESMIREFSK